MLNIESHFHVNEDSNNMVEYLLLQNCKDLSTFWFFSALFFKIRKYI